MTTADAFERTNTSLPSTATGASGYKGYIPNVVGGFATASGLGTRGGDSQFSVTLNLETLNTIIAEMEYTLSIYITSGGDGTDKYTINGKDYWWTQADKTKLEADYRAALTERQQLILRLARFDDARPETQAAIDANAAASAPTTFSSGTKWNASFTKDSYFNAVQSLMNGFVFGDREDNVIYASNTPSMNLETITSLFNDKGKGSKGVIRTWEFPAGAEPTLNTGEETTVDMPPVLDKYGFQFQYNPSTVVLEYSLGAIDFDPFTVARIGAGPMYNSQGLGTFSLTLLLNRRKDITMMTSGGIIRPGYDFTKEYAGTPPDAAARKAIYDKGTMYDIEYLFNTQMPIVEGGFKTQLRGKTSDIGLLFGIPVEVHLGKSMRYVCTVGSVQIEHQMFDHRMVPLISWVNIGLARIPDFTTEGA